MDFPRSSGILLHPTSLPGPWGIGDLGSAAYRFIDFLAAAGQRLWQVLPLGPTGYGDSPYQCFSAFAGNPLLVSLDELIAHGLLGQVEVEAAARAAGDLGVDHVDYGWVIGFKLGLLRASYERMRDGVAIGFADAFESFCAEQAGWLDDYALFMALKEQHGGASWSTWAPELRSRKAAALRKAQRDLAEPIMVQKYLQFLFFSQWAPLKAYANARDIKIIGDAPIFVAYDSADVWANPKLFYLDDEGGPTVVAGVPPDYFSATGQLWGNPLYRWDRMAKDGYVWWIARLRQTLAIVDILRLDHFRGFEAYWEVPAAETTAINGTWVKGPGAAIFARLREALGELPIIAEDLGLITPEVIALREQFGFPGMKVLQFAFGDDSSNAYLPHNYAPGYVVYSGTHDNNTTRGWFQDIGEEEREAARLYLGRDGSDIAWDLFRLALMSVADISVVPLQDILRLGSEARMNTPGRPDGNWGWRLRDDALSDGLAFGIRLLTAAYGRV
ncbi:4-alpha-glucanotransferase [Oscillochloris sp. ZM17-4]|uniref:4-alpha-glucanotransferase n=1 Tax=Oscillochloris sp. ZM17-4 TaxID=2866714 RepID=UPI001C732848|nr:4-alpha-glucanotransferase [Oscillochloris sp. ZM17-4]MBX0328489.1 4-alpha-glucanotransferase [Oscillochloris sp. ZM17-4]